MLYYLSDETLVSYMICYIYKTTVL